jgi:hypothetical protein
MQDYTDIGEYESLRVIQEVHRIGRSQHPSLVRSSAGHTIMLSERNGYMTFRIVENGLEIPVFNVASAIPKGATAAVKTQKTTSAGLTPKAKAPKRNKPNEPSPK